MEGGQVGGGEGGVPPTVLAHPGGQGGRQHFDRGDDDHRPVMNPVKVSAHRVGDQEEDPGKEVEQGAHPAQHLHPLPQQEAHNKVTWGLGGGHGAEGIGGWSHREPGEHQAFGMLLEVAWEELGWVYCVLMALSAKLLSTPARGKVRAAIWFVARPWDPLVVVFPRPRRSRPVGSGLGWGSTPPYCSQGWKLSKLPSGDLVCK